MSSKGELWTSVNYGQTFTYRAAYGNGQYFELGGLAISSDGSKAIAVVLGLGKLGSEKFHLYFRLIHCT